MAVLQTLTIKPGRLPDSIQRKSRIRLTRVILGRAFKEAMVLIAILMS